MLSELSEAGVEKIKESFKLDGAYTDSPEALASLDRYLVQDGKSKVVKKTQQMSEEEYERESENLSARMEELCSDQKVGDFILAEVDFSKLFQYITERLVGTLDD